MSSKTRTYQTRISIDEQQDILLSTYSATFSRAERALFARLKAGDCINYLKRDFQKRFGITARQFNSLNIQLSGRIQSIRKRQSGLIDTLKRRIKRAKQVIKKTTDLFALHQKKRRLAIVEGRLNQLQNDKVVKLCFGSKKLFRSQFYLKENGYSSHGEWLRDWRFKRNNQFLVVGSKDETVGCQSCVATVAEDGSITLKLRLLNSMSKKYTVIKGLRFQYGHKEIVAAIGRNLSDNETDWQAINYRFLKDGKGWRVFVTINLLDSKRISDSKLGVIGIDINKDHLAVTETDRFGNPVEYFTVACNTYGKTAKQRKAIIGDAIKQVIVFAKSRFKPIVVEELDFQKKKAMLEKQSPRYARMLSSLSYTLIQTILRARAFDAGIEVFEVNPAYSSVIGEYKFKDRYGMSAHNAAALVIGRRFMGFREALPRQLQGTLPLSVRNRGRHVWSKWAVISRKARAALAAHRRSRKGSLLSPVFDKAQLVTIPSVAGEIPACEPSAKLFG